jgi:UDP-glucuronate 4-epimerase
VSGILASIHFVETEKVFEIINLGESEPIDLNTMVLTLEKALGQKAILIRLPMQAGDVNVTYADISKAKRLLNYQPITSFEEGICKFVEWFKING